MMAAAFAQSDAIRIEYLDGRTDENLSSALNASAKANFDRFESHTGVFDGLLPGHDPGELAGAST
jgi:hypothetical protein